MMQLSKGVVISVARPRPGLARLRVRVGEAVEPSFALSPVANSIAEGDEVLLNVTAARLGLGSDEGHPVVANLTRPESKPTDLRNEMKVRYTAAQVAAGATRSDSASSDATLGGMPVVVAELHSALAPVLGALRAELGSRRDALPVAYVMPDWCSLPMVLSDTVARARELGWLSVTVTCGQAFGGELEAASLPAGMLLACEAGARVAVVVGGPGHLGAAQPFGFSAAHQADALHAAAALGGRPVFSPRLSSADPRDRHRGISHHTRCILGRLLLTGVTIAAPSDSPEPLLDDLRDLAERSGSVVEPVEVPDYEPECSAGGLALRSMGRGPTDDPLYFAAAAAAGALAARIATEG